MVVQVHRGFLYNQDSQRVGNRCKYSLSPGENRKAHNMPGYAEEQGISGSMSRPACPYDNSCVESFFATLKKEQIYKRKYDTMEEVRRDMFEYIELFYNRKRMQSHLGYMSPVEYRLKHTT